MITHHSTKVERCVGQLASLCIKPGEKLQIINYEGRIELMRIKAIKDMRGFLKGIDTTVVRQKDRT